MQALILVYPSKKFFIQAIKENIVSPSHFSGLCKPFFWFMQTTSLHKHRLKKK
jgi:hypothetical protein